MALPPSPPNPRCNRGAPAPDAEAKAGVVGVPKVIVGPEMLVSLRSDAFNVTPSTEKKNSLMAWAAPMLLVGPKFCRTILISPFSAVNVARALTGPSLGIEADAAKIRSPFAGVAKLAHVSGTSKT